MPDFLQRPEKPIRRMLQWDTGVIVGHDGSEQRFSRLQRPRQSVTLRALFQSLPEVRKMRTQLFRQLDEAWNVPTWWFPDRLATAVAAAGTSWVYNGDGRSRIVAGDRLLVVSAYDDDVSEVITVDSTDGSTITSTTGAANAYPVGSEILRLVAGTPQGPPSVQRHRTGQEELTISLDIPTDDPALVILTQHAPPTGGGETLYVMAPIAATAGSSTPLASGPTSYSADALLDRVDFGGNFDAYTRADFAAFTEQRAYHLIGRGGIDVFEYLFSEVGGGRDPFYHQTHREDLVVVDQPLTPFTTFTVEDESDTVADTFDYAGQWWTKSGYRQIRITNTDGTTANRTVASVVDNQDGTISLTVNPALSAGKTIDTIAFLEVVRLASDALVFEHRGSDATCSLATKAVTSDDSEAI